MPESWLHDGAGEAGILTVIKNRVDAELQDSGHESIGSFEAAEKRLGKHKSDKVENDKVKKGVSFCSDGFWSTIWRGGQPYRRFGTIHGLLDHDFAKEIIDE